MPTIEESPHRPPHVDTAAEAVTTESTAAGPTAEPIVGPITGSPPDPAGRRPGMFNSLTVPNYRLFAGGQVVSNIGTWMQRVAQDWLVLVLTGNDPVALGIAAALQFLPTVMFSMWAGVLADRLDKRRMLVVLQVGIALCALVLGVLDLTGLVELWQVYLLCFVLGVFTAVEVPVRQSFVAEMVGSDRLPNAVALNSTTFNLARIVGPAIAGIAITTVGTGWVFVANAVATCAVIAGLVAMNPAALHRSPALRRAKGQLAEGLRYVRGRRDLVIVMALVFWVSTFGITFFATLAIVAATVFHRDADGYGLLSTALAVGTFAGALLSARRGARARPRLRTLFVAAIAFGVLEVAAGLMPTFLAFAIALVPVGFAVMTFMTTANSIVQISVEPQMRGRVMGLYMLVFLGGNPVGGPVAGWAAEQWGGRSPLVIGGALAALAALVGAALLARSTGMTGRMATRTRRLVGA